MAHCLQMDIMEPTQQSSRAGELVPVLGVVYRLHKDVQYRVTQLQSISSAHHKRSRCIRDGKLSLNGTDWKSGTTVLRIYDMAPNVDLEEKLIYRVEIYVRGEIRGFTMSPSDIDYPALLYQLDPSQQSENAEEQDFQTGWFPTLRSTCHCTRSAGS
eukprot:3076229-Amphidinium_carterae.2